MNLSFLSVYSLILSDHIHMMILVLIIFPVSPKINRLINSSSFLSASQKHNPEPPPNFQIGHFSLPGQDQKAFTTVIDTGGYVGIDPVADKGYILFFMAGNG